MKTTATDPRALVDKLSLHRISPSGPAGLLICSLPLPRQRIDSLSVKDRPTARFDLGQWPGEAPLTPRRALLIADNAGEAADTLSLQTAAASPNSAQTVPDAKLVLVEESPEAHFFWERHAVRISWGTKSVDLIMGMNVRGEVHWWETCGIVVTKQSPLYSTVEAGGVIPRTITGFKQIEDYPGYTNPYLHRHEWLNGHIFLRLHANGVCEVFAHHVNSKFFDDGLPLDDAVPVLGIRAVDNTAAAKSSIGPWTGATTALDLDGIRFDLTEAARLSTPDKPGSLEFQEKYGFLVWQPYLGMELYGGLCPQSQKGDPVIVQAEQKIIPRGMGRTLRFSFSLNSQRSPVVARYLAPGWWYGHCEELTTAPLLPVSNVYDGELDASGQWALATQVKHGFEDGSIPRHESKDRRPPHEPGWEGETGYSLFIRAWRNGHADLYDGALRSAYHIADIVVDHAAFLMRMHGFPPNAFSGPMQRVLTLIAGYLETADPYLLQTARSVSDNAYWTHKNSWPRMCIGRDASFIRGQMMLYRYFADEHYLQLAHDAALDVANSQRPNGSFGDQGGGSGIHGWSAYITKPWMGFMATGGLLDYLELAPEDPRLLETVRRFADWLMLERYDHAGVMGWGYQHDYHGGRKFCASKTGVFQDLPGPGLWHHNYIARFMMFNALRFRKAAYFDAWAESQAAHFQQIRDAGMYSDHSTAQSGQFLPWTQARLWNARLQSDGSVVCEPVYAGTRTPPEGVIATPFGNVQLTWNPDNSVASSDPRVKVNSARILD